MMQAHATKTVRLLWPTLLKAALLFILVAVSTSAFAQKRVALVIGNADYRAMPTLINPLNDAEDVNRSLEELGFTTIYETNLDRHGMDRALGRFSRELSNAEIAVVFYAGHGMQLGGKNWLLPIDAKLDQIEDVNRYHLLPLDDILEMVQHARGARVVILDACRSNPVEQELKRQLASVAGANRNAILSRGLERIAAGNGLIVAYATQANDVASDGMARNSPFTQALLKHVAVADVDLRQMFHNVQDEVDQLTNGRQRPELSISLVGSFKLRVAKAEPDKKLPAVIASPNPAVEQAERAWAVTKDTTSIAVLENFIGQFDSTIYGSMARARLEELKKRERAALVPAVRPPETEIDEKKRNSQRGIEEGIRDLFQRAKNASGALARYSGVYSPSTCVEFEATRRLIYSFLHVIWVENNNLFFVSISRPEGDITPKPMSKQKSISLDGGVGSIDLYRVEMSDDTYLIGFKNNKMWYRTKNDTKFASYTKCGSAHDENYLNKVAKVLQE